MKFAHKFKVWRSLKSYLRKKFYPPPEIGGNALNFAELPPTRRQSEALNFEIAQHTEKQQEGQHPLTGQRATNFRLLANQ